MGNPTDPGLLVGLVVHREHCCIPPRFTRVYCFIRRFVLDRTEYYKKSIFVKNSQRLLYLYYISRLTRL